MMALQLIQVQPKNTMEQVGQLLLQVCHTARAYLAGNGIQTAALAFGGNTGTANTGATEEYDGTSWTAGGNLNTARMQLARSRNSNSSFSFWWWST
jgi:hypothetical protein